MKKYLIPAALFSAVLFSMISCNFSFAGQSEKEAFTLSASFNSGNGLYFQDDTFESSSLSIQVKYPDGNTKTVTECKISGFDSSTAGISKQLSVSYTEGDFTKEIKVPYYVAAKDAKPSEELKRLDGYEGSVSGGTYYEFGQYPQTVSSLADNSYSPIPLYKGYYLGSDGYFYKKAEENAYSKGYKYSNGESANLKSNHSQKFFKVEPLVWRALKDDYNGKGTLLLAEKILNSCRFSSEDKKTLFSESLARDFLNNDFKAEAFTTNSSNLLETIRIYDADNKVFLAAPEELSGISYQANKDYVRRPSDYALANHLDVTPVSGSEGGIWWLRKYGVYQEGAHRIWCVDKDGKSGITETTNYQIGLVPAIVISPNVEF